MRRSIIWFALAVAWAVDCLLAFVHHNRLQAGLTAFFACCFFAVGLLFRKHEQKQNPATRRAHSSHTRP
jgi:hypothetical protein